MRTSWLITWMVWKALFLREVVARLSARRAAWVWILLEPIMHIVFLYVLFGFVLQKVVSGIDGGLFMTTGVLGFFLAQNAAMRSKDAIQGNAALLIYRQVLPVDTVLVRGALEALLFMVVALCLFTGLGLLGYQVFPHNFLQVMVGFGALWLSGMGLGLMLSVGTRVNSRTRESRRDGVSSLVFSVRGHVPGFGNPPCLSKLAPAEPLYSWN